MKKSWDELIDELIKKISQLPAKRQKAMYFVIDNFHPLKRMCENSKMTDEEIQKWTAKAEENDDCIMLALLTAVQLFNGK